ncbi:MAG TPA: GEVED domain-containing protein, partial [Anaerolineae bacterium]|nr:GEVED domain-containing protein [Anaerolineae bacterium]
IELTYHAAAGYADCVIPRPNAPLHYFVQAVDPTGNVALALDHSRPFTAISGATPDPMDWGDLPEPYATTDAAAGPWHIIVKDAPYLGSAPPTGAADGQPSFYADRDGSDNGVGRAAGLGHTDGGWSNGAVIDGHGGALTVQLSAADACLGAFFDFDGSDSLTAVPLRNNSGGVIGQPLAPGTYTFYFDVPAGTFTGSGTNPLIYARFRVTSPRRETCTDSAAYSSAAPALDGEVEDYAWEFTPNALATHTLRGNGGALWGGLLLLGSGLVWSAAAYRRRRASAK